MDVQAGMDCEWNKGFWSWENETWFRKRREDILAGRGKPLSAKEWEGKLRHGRWRKSLTRLQEVAELRIQFSITDEENEVRRKLD